MRRYLDNQTGGGNPDPTKWETLEDYVEATCPYYYRLDVLFGCRPNIRPSFAEGSAGNLID